MLCLALLVLAILCALFGVAHTTAAQFGHIFKCMLGELLCELAIIWLIKEIF